MEDYLRRWLACSSCLAGMNSSMYAYGVIIDTLGYMRKNGNRLREMEPGLADTISFEADSCQEGAMVLVGSQEV